MRVFVAHVSSSLDIHLNLSAYVCVSVGVPLAHHLAGQAGFVACSEPAVARVMTLPQVEAAQQGRVQHHLCVGSEVYACKCGTGAHR